MARLPPISVLAFLLSATTAAAQDEFIDRHSRALAASPTTDFSVRVKDGRSTFRVGERIPLELVYSPSVGLYVNWAADRCLRVHFDRPVAPHPKIDAHRFFDGVPGGILGPLYEGGPPRPNSVITIEAILTNRYAFDAPGRYRLFVESLQRKNRVEISNILEFEVLPRDPAWEAQVISRAEATLATRRTDHSAVHRSFQELRALRSNTASAVLAREFETRDDLSGTHEIWPGLVENPDRQFVLDALHRELRDPRRAPGPLFDDRLAHLELDARPSAKQVPSHDRFLAMLDDLALERAKALSAIPGRLEAEIIREMTDARSGEGGIPGGVVRVGRRFPAAMTAAFAAADALAQRSALTFGWRHFNDPVFLPLLRAAYTSPAGGDQGVRDIALRRLYEVAPDEGRQVMLEELGRPRPRVSIGILALLPDVAFPDLEARWLQQLQSARLDADRRPAAERIERFGTATLGVPIERFYRRASNGLRCATRAALLAYMVRVQVPAAERLLTDAATGRRWDETCPRPLITEVAELEWNSVVERATIAALAHPDPALIEAAADILAQRGSLVARGPLEQRLKTVIASIRGLAKRQGDAAARRHDHLQYVAWRVADAIEGAKRWLLTAEDRRALAALCESGHTDCDFTREDADPPHVINISPSVRRVDAFDVSVDHHPLASLQDLREKLGQFRSGTRVHWNDWPTGPANTLDRWTWSERDALFEAFRRDAATHGVLLQRAHRSSDEVSCPSESAGRDDAGAPSLAVPDCG